MTATTPFLKGSPAPRYWNMARQRYCRRLARYRNTRSVSADPGTKPAAHTRAESRGFGPSKVDAAERQTLRWREGDSNRRSLPKKRRFSEQHPLYLSPCGSTIGTTNAPSARAATACVARSGRGRAGRGGLPKVERAAARIFRLAADRGDAAAQAKLGFFYRGACKGLSGRA